jgi:acyl-CoA hydrolase
MTKIARAESTMQKRVAAAQARRITAEDAAAMVQPGMWIDYGASFNQPDVFDRALAARKDELSQIKIRGCLTVKPRAVHDVDPAGEVFFNFSWHFSGYDRKKHDAGIVNYMPLNLGEVPDYYRRFIDPVDIAIIKCRPMDENGNFNLSATNLWHRAIVERAKVVIIEECDGLPHVEGHENDIHVSEVDFILSGENGPTPGISNPPPTDVDRAVAEQIAGEIEDGACLQIGIGGMPNAVCTLLVDSSVKDLGIHTEMLTDGIIDLYQSGRVTGARKTINQGKIVFTFALGSQKLYDAVNRNPDILCYPVDYTNLPHIIMQNDRVVSINNTTQIDLQGQAASESDGHRHISGTGGQLQFVRGAYASKGGKSFICLASTYDKRGERRSRIVLNLTPGNVVTTPRSDVMYVVTEYGMINLKGKSVAERANALISIAHPDFREDLERQARQHGLIPRGLQLG